jgi:stage II sporulation protein D
LKKGGNQPPFFIHCKSSRSGGFGALKKISGRCWFDFLHQIHLLLEEQFRTEWRFLSLFSGKKIGILVFLFFAGFSANPASGRAGRDVKIRVKILELAGPVAISGKNLTIAYGRGRAKRLGADSLLLEPEGSKVRIRDKVFPAPVKISASANLAVRGRQYRGDFLVAENNGLILVNEVLLEDYLYGVINNEISSSWPVDAVKAQAVLARTYAVLRKEQRKGEAYDLDSTVKDQVYLGMASEDEAARKAVDETRGIILTFRGEPVEALYHSSCGGRTESPHYVWGGEDKPYQRSVSCGFCEEAPHYFWRHPADGNLSGAELARVLGLNAGIRAVRVLERSPSGRVIRVQFRTDQGEVFFSGQELRKKLGFDQLRSTAFEIKLEDKGLVFFGSGSGHGVGMCQWGARGMAEQGYHYEEILLHYFPGTRVSRIH